MQQHTLDEVVDNCWLNAWWWIEFSEMHMTFVLWKYIQASEISSSDTFDFEVVVHVVGIQYPILELLLTHHYVIRIDTLIKKGEKNEVRLSALLIAQVI